MPTFIAKLYLYEVGHIQQLHYDQWLFQALLAPKPHQEHVRDIEDFSWHFWDHLSYFSVRHRCP